MKATELRIGNLLQDKSTDEFLSIIELTTDSIKCYFLNKTEQIFFINGRFSLLEKSQVKPIPLTEEWLLKFGFKPNILTFIYNNIEVAFDSKKYLRLCGYSFISGDEYPIPSSNKCFIKPIKYVHQLQNLYFALCGKELIIKVMPLIFYR